MRKNKYNTYNLQMAGWGDVLATMIGFNDDFESETQQCAIGMERRHRYISPQTGKGKPV